MIEHPVPRAFEQERIPIEERIPETLQIGRARLKCYLCGSVLRPTRETLMSKGARCKCGALAIPARPDPCAANGDKINRWYGRRRRD
jgi:hypothetical protein